MLSASSAAPGETARSPFRGPGLWTRVAPFAVVAVLAEASLLLPSGTESGRPRWPASLLLLLTAAGFLLPWARLPRWMTVLVPLTCTGSVLALDLTAGSTSGVGIVILIPLVWTALFHRPWEVGMRGGRGRRHRGNRLADAGDGPGRGHRAPGDLLDRAGGPDLPRDARPARPDRRAHSTGARNCRAACASSRSWLTGTGSPRTCRIRVSSGSSPRAQRCRAPRPGCPAARCATRSVRPWMNSINGPDSPRCHLRAGAATQERGSAAGDGMEIARNCRPHPRSASPARWTAPWRRSRGGSWSRC